MKFMAVSPLFNDIGNDRIQGSSMLGDRALDKREYFKIIKKQFFLNCELSLNNTCCWRADHKILIHDGDMLLEGRLCNINS